MPPEDIDNNEWLFLDRNEVDALAIKCGMPTMYCKLTGYDQFVLSTLHDEDLTARFIERARFKEEAA